MRRKLVFEFRDAVFDAALVRHDAIRLLQTVVVRQTGGLQHANRRLWRDTGDALEVDWTPRAAPQPMLIALTINSPLASSRPAFTKNFSGGVDSTS